MWVGEGVWGRYGELPGNGVAFGGILAVKCDKQFYHNDFISDKRINNSKNI